MDEKDIELVNPAITLLRFLVKLKEAPDNISMVVAIARAMPLGEGEDTADAKLFAPRRIAVIVDTIRELIELVGTVAVRREAALDSLRSLLDIFVVIGTNAGADWGSQSGRVNQTILNSVETLAHALKDDRADLSDASRSECAAALAALRQLLATLPSGSPEALELSNIVGMLEAAFLASYIQGANPLADIMSKWQRHHALVADALAHTPDEYQEKFWTQYAPAAMAFKRCIDRALWAYKLLELAKAGTDFILKLGKGG